MSDAENVRRSNRRIQPKSEAYQSEESVSKYHKWSPEEQQTILYCLKTLGHKDIDNISKHLPQKTSDEIKRFLLSAHTEARKKDGTVPNIKYWLDRCKGEMEKTDSTKSNYLFISSQVIKYLSIDGLLENHPKPENCEDINFAAAYKLLYQALMGYPLQPVNKATADFICESFKEINTMRNPGLVSKLSNLIKKKCDGEKETDTDSAAQDVDLNVNQDVEKQFIMKKPLIVYKRKRPASVPASPTNAPPLKVVFEEKDVATSGSTKCYSLAIGGKSEESPLIVPVPVKITKTELEEAASKLWSDKEFNPLELPDEFKRMHHSQDGIL